MVNWFIQFATKLGDIEAAQYQKKIQKLEAKDNKL